MKDVVSAGLLMFDRQGEGSSLRVLLVHPGGPFFRNKDEGAWSVPKGLPEAGETLEQAAKREFREELGFAPAPPYMPLGEVRQKAGKRVVAWAFHGELPQPFVLTCNTFEVEWPPRSGRRQSFPEVDKAEMFSLPVAREKINPAQAVFLDTLLGLADGGFLPA